MQHTPPLGPAASRPPPALVLLLLLTAAAYAALALAGYVFDDAALVRDNTVVGDPSRWAELWTADLWETSAVGKPSGHYRPLMLVSLAVDRLLYDQSAAGHHLHSVAWHLGTVIAVYTLLRRLASAPGALVGAAVFALHPIQSEAVAFISARNDPMVAFFTVMALVVLLPRQVQGRGLWAGGLLTLAALLCKETGALVAPVLLLLDLARWGRPGGGARYAVALGAVLVYLGLRHAVGVSSNPMTEVANWPILFGNLPELAAHLASRVLWPWPLTVGHSLEYLHLGAGEVAFGLGGGAALAAVLVARGGRLAAAGLLAGVLAFAPAILAIVARGQIGERYFYLSLSGLGLAVAAAWPVGWSPLRGAPLAVLALWGLHLRLPDWASDLTLWQAAVRDAPNSFTFTGLGHIWNQQEQPERACPLFRQALEVPNVYPPACFPAVNCPLKQGQISKAVEAATLTERLCPPDRELAAVQALAYAHFGLWDRAQARLGAPEADPEVMSHAVTTAALALRAGDLEAVAALRQAWGPEGPQLVDRAERVLEVALEAERWRSGGATAPAGE